MQANPQILNAAIQMLDRANISGAEAMTLITCKQHLAELLQAATAEQGETEETQSEDGTAADNKPAGTTTKRTRKKSTSSK